MGVTRMTRYVARFWPLDAERTRCQNPLVAEKTTTARPRLVSRTAVMIGVLITIVLASAAVRFAVAIGEWWLRRAPALTG